MKVQSHTAQRRARLIHFENHSRKGSGRMTKATHGRAFVEQWLVCSAWGEAADWERRARAWPRSPHDLSSQRLAFELGRLRALGHAFGLGDSWESIERGDFLELVTPTLSARDVTRPSPFVDWYVQWAMRFATEPESWRSYARSTGMLTGSGAAPGEDDVRELIRRLMTRPTTDRGLVYTWRDQLAQCVRVRLARSNLVLYEGSGPYHASASCLAEVGRALARVVEPCVEFLGRCIDPWGAGVHEDELLGVFGYPAERPDLFPDD